jgi:hypothetical protein
VATLVLLLGLLAPPGRSESYWDPEEVRKVAARSELIVVARVVSVVAFKDKPSVAFATVEETWKGLTHEHIQFHASPSWQCDGARAVEGETVLLFLSRDPGKPYSIDASGRGRLPFRDIDGVKYVTILNDFVLPPGIPTVPGPDPKFSFMRSVELSRVRDLVQDVLRAEVTPRKQDESQGASSEP